MDEAAVPMFKLPGYYSCSWAHLQFQATAAEGGFAGSVVTVHSLIKANLTFKITSAWTGKVGLFW